MLNKDAATVLHRDVESICAQILKAYQELVEFTRTLSELDPELAELIGQKVSQVEPGLGELLQKNRLYFEIVLLLDDAALTEVLKRADKKVLTIALKGCEEAVQNQFFRNMSSKSAELMKEEMEFLGPVRVRDIHKCRQEILAVIEALNEEGVIAIGGHSGPDDYVA